MKLKSILKTPAAIAMLLLFCPLLPRLVPSVHAVSHRAAMLHAQKDEIPRRKKVGLVLSGGGAKGIAHISAIKVLEEAGIPIDYISGTSMGAIVGGLYAIGYSTHVLDSMVRTQDWNTLIYDRLPRSDLSFGAKEHDEKYLVTVEIGPERRVQLPSGLIGGNNVYNLLYELTFGYHDPISFMDLPIPFTCMAYDMVRGNVVALDEGYLPDAIRASMSIPGAFQAVTLDSMVLVDGGIGNNFPCDVARRMGADIVIGIDVTAPLKKQDELTSFAAIFDQITSFTALEAYNNNMKDVDLYVHPDITGYSAASFSADAIDTLLKRGEAATREKWDDIVALKKKIGVPDDYEPTRVEPIRLNPPIPIEEIEFVGLRSENEKVLRKTIGIKEYSVVTSDDLRTAVTKLMGTRSLSDIQYRLEGDSTFKLIFDVKESHKNTISAGFRFDTEEMASILLNVKYAGKNMTNTHLDLTGRLGANPYGRLAVVYGNETQNKISFSYTFRSNDLNIYRHGKKVTNLDFDNHTVNLNFSNIRVRNFRVALGVNYDYYHFNSLITNLEPNESIGSERLISYYGLAQWESFNSRYYPTRGQELNVSYTMSTDDFLRYKDGPPFGAIKIDYMAVLSPGHRISIIPGVFGRVLIGNNVSFMSYNFMGGAVAGRYLPQQIPFAGLFRLEPFDKSVVGAKLDFRVRLWARNYISLKTVYAKHADNFFNIVSGEEIFGIGLNYSYNSFIGPIDFLIDYSNYDKKIGLYFNLGYYF